MAEALPALPRLNRLLYASASFGGNVLSRSRDLWLIYFYAPPPESDLPARVPMLVLGALLLAARVIEALDDPLIGWWSDRTRSRWGRRIPFVLLATPFYALFAALLWMPPEPRQSALNAAYLFIVLETFYLFSTLSGGPFESLLPEIAPRSQDRVSIVTWQVFFGTLGAFVALVISGIIVDTMGFQAMGITMAILAFVSRYVGLAGAWRYARRDVEPVRIDFLAAVRACLANDQFRAFLPTFILFNMAISMLTAALPYWAQVVLLGGHRPEILRLEHGHELLLQLGPVKVGLGVGTVVGILTGMAILVVLASLPLVYQLSIWRGKAWVYSAAMLFASFYLPWLAFMGFIPGVNPLLQAVLMVAIIGLPMTAVYTFPNAIQADIIDYDALRTGQRREAIYYATQATLEKIASAAFPPILALLLALGSTAENPLGIRLVGVVAGLASFLGWLTFRTYWLPDQVTPETMATRLSPRR
jgi:GPH family glycoside/pentoside/hexuronide:cation symporter